MKKISLLMLTLLLSVVSFAQKPVSGQRAEVFPGPQSIPADMVSVKLDYEKDAYTAPWRARRAASDYDIITEQPEGTLKQYTRAGSYIGGDGYIYSQSGFADIVFAADGTTVYFKDLVACYEFGTWVKGTIEGNTITVPLGQPIYYLNDTYGAVFLGITYPSTARTIDGNLTFTVTENTITLDTYTTYSVGVIGGCFNYNSTLYGMQAFSGRPYGEYATLFTLFEEPEVVTPPAGLETADFPMTASENASTDYNATVKVGWNGNDVYIQGLNKYLPEAWVMGTLDTETKKVTFPIQYMGKDASSPYYLTGYTSKGNMPAVTMDYDADSKTFTGNGSIAMNSSSTSWAAVVFYNGVIIGTPPTPIVVPDGLETKSYSMEGKYTEDGETLVDIAEDYVVKIGVAEGVYYIQGLLPNVPEGWVQGTLADGKLTIPAGQYVGKDTKYGIGQYIVAGTDEAIENLVLTYDATNDKYTLDNGVYASRKKNSIAWYLYLDAGAIIGIRSAVNIADGIENGTIAVDKPKAFTGDVVTVTATPAEGFKLDAITVKAADESAIEVSAENTFVMPAQAVTVSATFAVLPVDVVVEAADIAEGKITEAIAAKAAGKPVKNLTLNLGEGGNYTITNAIESDGSVIINGNGATIDASGLEGNFIQRKTEPAEWTEANVAITGVTVKGLKNALFYSGVKKYFGDVTIDNCVVEQAADATTFDYTKGSTAVNFTITNSTFYAPTATTKSFYSSQGGQKTTEYNGEAIETFTFTNNTMYNLAPGKNFFTHRQNSQKWLKYVAKGNIFVNCGKSGQVIKGMNGGGSSANPQFDIDGNAFNYEVEGVMTDTSASEETGDAEEPVKNSVAGIVTFPKVAEGKFDGKFRLAEGATAPASLGDPRWALKIIAPVTITPHTPVKAKASDYAEIIQTNDLTKKWSDNSWTLTDEAKTWVVYNYDDATEGDIQQTNRANVWFDFNSEYEDCDNMIIYDPVNYDGYFTVTSKTNGTSGLLVVGKNRYPEFNITGTEKAKFYFSGSSSTAGYAQVEVYEGDATEPVQKKTGDIALTKSTWDKSTLLIVDGLDKEKTYKIVARSVNADGAYEGGDIVLQVVKLYPENLPAKIRPVDIEVSPASGDIAAAVTEAKEGIAVVGNITINLTKGATYTVASTIEAPAGITINGNGATIDASALEGNFIERTTAPEEWTEGNVAITGVTVKGLKKALFYSGVKGYFGDVTIDNCVVEQAGDATTFDYTKGSTAVNFTVTNSTFYAPTATTMSFYSSQGGQKTTEYNGDAVQTFTFANNTMYNLATGKNFFSHRQSNQKWLKYVVKNNIFVNCGKSGQVIKGMNGGQSGTNPTWDIDGNAFNFETEGTMNDTNEAEDTGDAEEPVKNSVAGVVVFADAAKGDFTLGACAAKDASIGDPRWLPAYSTSLNIEKLVLEEGTKADIDAILAEHNIQFANINALDSLNDNKGMLRNEAYLGLKVKKADAYIKVLVKKGQVLNVKLGYIADAVNVSINGTVDESKQIAQKKDLSSTVFTLAAAEADQEVTFTTTTGSTVVFKQIMIGEDIADVTLPVQTKFEITKAEGITNGDITFAATTLTNTKAPFMVEKGDEVTVTATPADGYELEAITVKGVTSNEVITVTEGKFTMPADAVTVSATFKEKQGDGIATIKAEALENAVIYNLKGERVEKTQAQGGVFIVNGKKVAIK